MTTHITPAQIRSDLVASVISAIGHCYAFGGAPGLTGGNCWDCSSCVNYIVSYEGLAIPGYGPGKYDGSVHGPSTLGWLAWQGQGVGSIDRSQVQGGDIMCWRTHMGIAISNTEMVSALNASATTEKTAIDGLIPGEQLVPLRLAVIGPGGITLPTPTVASTTQVDRITRDVARATRGMVDIGQRLRTIGVRRV